MGTFVRDVSSQADTLIYLFRQMPLVPNPCTPGTRHSRAAVKHALHERSFGDCQGWFLTSAISKILQKCTREQWVIQVSQQCPLLVLLLIPSVYPMLF
jgi:hypothetical protein